VRLHISHDPAAVTVLSSAHVHMYLPRIRPWRPVMQDIARQQMQAAWSSKPKIDVALDLQAPKVAIPIADSSSSSKQVTLLVDLGSLVLTSNHAEASTLSPEEASIYDCYGLLSSDLSVHIISGAFAWPRHDGDSGPHEAAGVEAAAPKPQQAMERYLGQGAQAVPLLDHCSTSASVHMAYVSHPTLPMVRVGLQVLPSCGCERPVCRLHESVCVCACVVNLM
jgi:Repeating coiled region of VPS13